MTLIHISEPTGLRRISYAVFCLKKKKKTKKKLPNIENSNISDELSIIGYKAIKGTLLTQEI